MAVKIDMSKAYDRVEWGYLKEVMLRMGFTSEWVRLVMNCVSTISYAITINGKSGRIFSPSRGLRQGDPLSPFPFLICSEGLSSFIRMASEAGLLKGAKANRRGLEILHFLFADDCILLREASDKGTRVLKEILKEYRKCSRQCVNFNKLPYFLAQIRLKKRWKKLQKNWRLGSQQT